MAAIKLLASQAHYVNSYKSTLYGLSQIIAHMLINNYLLICNIPHTRFGP